MFRTRAATRRIRTRPPLLRVDRLESQVRDLNGQVEQLQFQVKRLEDALRKFQSDADSRLDQSSRPSPAAPAAPN